MKNKGKKTVLHNFILLINIRFLRFLCLEMKPRRSLKSGIAPAAWNRLTSAKLKRNVFESRPTLMVERTSPCWVCACVHEYSNRPRGAPDPQSWCLSPSNGLCHALNRACIWHFLNHAMQNEIVPKQPAYYSFSWVSVWI